MFAGRCRRVLAAADRIGMEILPGFNNGIEVRKAATAAKIPFVGEAAEKAMESIRRRNAG